MKRGALNTIIKKIQSECCLEEPTKITYFWNDKNQAVFKLFFDSLYIPDDLVLEEEDVLNTFSRQDAYLYEDDFRIDEINTKKGYLTFIPNTQDFKTVSRYKDAKEAKDDSKDKSEIQQECYLVIGKHLNEAFSKWNNFILQEEDDDQQEVEQDTETAEVETDEASAEQENQSDGTEDTDEPNDDGKPDDEDTDTENPDDIMSNDDHQKKVLDQRTEEKSDKPSSVNSAYLNCFSLPAPLTTAGSAALRKTLGSILNGETPVVKGASGKDEVKKVVCFDVNQSVELTETTGASFQVFSEICKEICGGETWAYSAVASGNALSQKLDSMKGGSVRYLDKGSASIVQKSNVAGIKGLTVEGGEDAEQNSAQTANLGEFNSITQIVKQILTEYRAECKKWGGGPKPIGDTKDHSTGGDKVSSGTTTQGDGASENDKSGTGYEDTADGQEASKGTDENGLADASTTDKDNPPEKAQKQNTKDGGKNQGEEKPEEGDSNSENTNNSNEANTSNGQDGKNSDDQNGEKAQGGKQGDQPKEGGEETGNPDTTNNDTAKVPGTKEVAMAGTPSKAEIDAAIKDWGKKEEAFNKDQENPEVYCALAYCRDYYTKDMNGVEKQDQEEVKKFRQEMEKFKQDCISGKVNIGSSKDLHWKERCSIAFAAGVDQMEKLGRDSMGAKRIDDIEDKASDSLFGSTHQTGTNSAVQTVDGQDKTKEEIKDVGNAYPYYFNVFCYNNANFKKLREFFKGNKELKFLKSGGGSSK